MISKERLQELIEQGATIYSNFGGISKIYLDYTDTYIKDDRLYEKDRKYGDLFVGNLENLFETKEEAEWALEFGNITRTETLSLPNYKVAKTYIDTDKFILGDNSSFKLLLLSNPDDIIIVDKQQGNQIFNKPLTKENYIKACELAKKLFLGVEV